jgi:hypothetical protein
MRKREQPKAEPTSFTSSANGLFSRDKMSALIAENQELYWIIAASIKTARDGAAKI